MAATREARKREMIANLDNDVYIKALVDEAYAMFHRQYNHRSAEEGKEDVRVKTEFKIRVEGPDGAPDALMPIDPKPRPRLRTTAKSWLRAAGRVKPPAPEGLPGRSVCP